MSETAAAHWEFSTALAEGAAAHGLSFEHLRLSGNYWHNGEVQFSSDHGFTARRRFAQNEIARIRQALGGGSLVLHNNGTQTRDFVYLDDVVDALVAAATAPDVDRRIINIGSGVETSIRALALAVGEVTGREVHLLNVGAGSGGVSRMRADLTRARELLGYEPKVFLMEGLQRMVKRDVRFTRMAAQG